jgi:hypothetical protein
MSHQAPTKQGPKVLHYKTNLEWLPPSLTGGIGPGPAHKSKGKLQFLQAFILLINGDKPKQKAM